MIYWVTGHQRTGTSMMMGCLIRGGMDAIYEDDEFSGHPTYEVKGISAEMIQPDWEGKLLKFHGPQLMKAHAAGDKVIMMRRDYDEVVKSHASQDTRVNIRRDRFERRWKMMDKIMSDEGVDVLQVWYPQAVAEPLKTFKRIADAGWPIDPHEAAKGVDPKLYRTRI